MKEIIFFYILFIILLRIISIIPIVLNREEKFPNTNNYIFEKKIHHLNLFEIFIIYLLWSNPLTIFILLKFFNYNSSYRNFEITEGFFFRLHHVYNFLQGFILFLVGSLTSNFVLIILYFISCII